MSGGTTTHIIEGAALWLKHGKPSSDGNVIAIPDLFEEELLPDPAAMADAIIRRLRDEGFVIWPYEAPKPPKP